MRRFLLCGVLMILLAGCGTAGEQTPEEVPEEVLEGETEALSGEGLVSSAMEAYAAITKDLTFTLDVTAEDAEPLTLSITPESAWNVAGLENLFPDSYQWEPSSASTFGVQWTDMENRGLCFTMTAPDGETTLRCCTGGDAVMWNVDGEAHYAQVTAVEDVGPGLGDLLRGIAEDALREMSFSAPTVDGAETDYEAIARQLNEAMAENVRAVPDWVSWKPLDFQAGGASVFDAYYLSLIHISEPTRLRLLVDDPEGAMANSWQAGSGLGEPDADGYYGYGGAVSIRRNTDGNWSCDGLATGGSSVDLPLSASGEEAPLPELVDAFFLTEGFSHDWLVPCYILEHPAEDMAVLPALLDQRTEEEARALCGVLGDCLRTADYWDWTPETLAAALGSYGAYLNA